MTESIIVAIITGVLTLVGVLISNSKTQAVMETKIENLTKAVEKHNNFAQRLPVIEERVNNIDHRLTNLEEERQ